MCRAMSGMAAYPADPGPEWRWSVGIKRRSGHVHAADRESSIAIVGGGIVGCATAYFLAKRGFDVALFERGSLACEQSSRAWGFIRQQGRHVAEMPLASEARRLWVELTEKFGIGVTELAQEGILVPAESPEDEARIVDGYDTARKFQLPTRILKPQEIAAVMPPLAGRWRSALFTPGDGHGEPGASSRAIGQAAREHGARIFEHEPVHQIDLSAGTPAGIVTSK